MKNKKGQSLIEIIFSMGIVILVLVGVVMLMVVTAKAKRIASERQKAIELSQQMIENTVLYSKNNTLAFWQTVNNYAGTLILPWYFDLNLGCQGNGGGYRCYTYCDASCNDTQCKLIFKVRWGDSQILSVERLFSREGL
ncbi:MAG: hypothetical protein PHP97_02940 [Candidatus Shapirobacteria bacterium]|nr:hypothetical protein [Candidatus Shapirobacteria bacterium]MDD3002322.1 hypothetical protein [Candidatus Shapirobacteria bacterium]MDD4382673.1 hypothetical protein [Candidatus Shapirobacteria bacterium]